jgi:hypothetical protein
MALALLGFFALTLLPGLVAEAPERITIGGLFPMIWAEEAECAGHLLAAADRINNKTDGYLDHVLPQVRPRVARGIPLTCGPCTRFQRVPRTKDRGNRKTRAPLTHPRAGVPRQGVQGASCERDEESALMTRPN